MSRSVAKRATFGLCGTTLGDANRRVAAPFSAPHAEGPALSHRA